MSRLERYGVIYKITNKINNKSYIGQTVRKNPMRRIQRHFQKSGKKHPLRNSIKHYGKDNFQIDLIFTTFDLKSLNWAEIYFIKKYNTICPNGYNLKFGGNQGGKCSENTKKKIGEKSRNWYSKNDHVFKGKKFSKEHIANLSKVRKGFTSEKRRLASKKSAENLRIKVKAICLKTGKEYIFESLTKCAEYLNLQVSNISRVCRKSQNRTQHKGYTFEYIH